MFKGRSKCTFIAALLASIYFIYLIMYFANVNNSNGSEAVSAGLATLLVMPHIAFVLLALIFNWLGFLLKLNWATLTGSILYCVSLVMFPIYFIFVLPSLILGFIGFANQKKINK